MFQLISESRFFPRMRVVVACRSYDLNHDSRLKGLVAAPDTTLVTLEPLNWTGQLVVTLGMRKSPGGILEVARRERAHRLAPCRLF